MRLLTVRQQWSVCAYAASGIFCTLHTSCSCCCPAQLQYANDIADLLAPQSGAYYDVWLDGEKFVSVYKEVRGAAAAVLQLTKPCARRLGRDLRMCSDTASAGTPEVLAGQLDPAAVRAPLGPICPKPWSTFGDLSVNAFVCSNTCLQDPKVTADRDFNGYGTNYTNSPEPIYGTQFLPRKFKVAVTVPGVCMRAAAGGRLCCSSSAAGKHNCAGWGCTMMCRRC
jgi:sulfite reductase beta subunit-like hemoprotein